VRRAAALLALVLATPASAQGLDGLYLGKLSCEMIAGQTRRELATEIRITIAGTTVNYEREIFSESGAPTGNKERGTGAVKGNSLSMAGAGRGNSWSYEASYNGTITGGTIGMRGVQKWYINRANQDRQCAINAQRR
jgi:hypothetical protein